MPTCRINIELTPKLLVRIMNDNDEKIPEMSVWPGAVGRLDDTPLISCVYFSLFIFPFDVDLICCDVLYLVHISIHYTLEATDYQRKQELKTVIIFSADLY